MDVCESIGAGRSGGAGGEGGWGGHSPFERCTQNLHPASPEAAGAALPWVSPRVKGEQQKPEKQVHYSDRSAC